MKLTINQKILEKALSHANSIIEKKQTMPILGYILFDANSEGLTITASNLDLTIVDNIECEVEIFGKYCLPAGLLYDITKKLKAGSDIVFELSSSDNSIKMTSNRASFNIHYMEPETFPMIAQDNYPISFKINSKIFKQSIDVAKVAMLQDNSRYHLQGIHIHYDKDDLDGSDKICFVATDLFRISCVSMKSSSESQNLQPIIISKRTVSEILKLIDSSACEEILISTSDNRISFELDASEKIKTEFSARLINGTFPEYKAALSVSNDKILIVNTCDIIEALERVSTVVFDSASSVKFAIGNEKLIISGVSRELGSAIEEIEASFSVLEPFEICFNSRYVLEILKEIATPQVKFLLAESNSSTIIQPTENAEKSEIDMIFAVMPIEIVKS